MLNEYSDLIIKCRVIENEDIGDYLNLIDDNNKFNGGFMIRYEGIENKYLYDKRPSYN